MRKAIIRYTVLAVYSIAVLLSLLFLNHLRDGGERLFRERWMIIVICCVLVEILNQLTFFLGQRNPGLVRRVRSSVFWAIFTGGAAWYLLLLLGLEPGASKCLEWRSELLSLTGLILIASGLPFYSECLNVRFLFLSGKFVGRRERGVQALVRGTETGEKSA